MASWTEQWENAVAKIDSNVHYQKSGDTLRSLIKTGLLRFTDLETNPERFFEAHRLVVDPIKRGPGFWIRFTVQYNLFAGTVLGLGGDEQRQELERIQDRGQLGCFGLTEKLAGVNSGLVVNTIATWDKQQQCFILHSPDEGAYKNWISQGLMADKCAVIADLRVGGTSYGPHGFLMDLRVDGKVVPGVELGDMGRKTTGNDLDNAWIAFNNVSLPKSALLNRFADIVNDEYVQTGETKMRIEVIGQRLLSGRVAVAQAALEFATKLYANTRAYSDSKKCWSPKGSPPLSKIPHIKALYAEADKELARLTKYAGVVEAKLNKCLRDNIIPSKQLVEAIAVCKVVSVERAIALTFRLKQEVGSYALMGDTGFEHMDFLQCCKFAEGDGRILMQKLARDRVKEMVKGRTPPGSSDQEIALAKHLMEGGRGQAWDDNFEKVYQLAWCVIERVLAATTPQSAL